MKHPTEQSYHDHTTLRQVVKDLKNESANKWSIKKKKIKKKNKQNNKKKDW